jgi:hypothetical protein
VPEGSGTEIEEVPPGRSTMLALLLFASIYNGGSGREIASMGFPQYRATSDVGDIMDDYPDYLRFALAIGKESNRSAANQLEERFTRLQKADEKLAARFLKGLRFEMVQKLELSGLSPKRVSTATPAMRKWVAKYLPAWLREVDEYQFRAYASAISRRNSRD